jgi:hypothetical protein
LIKKLEKEVIPSEKWIVAFKNYNNRNTYFKILIRYFYAQGYFEAYDIVQTFSKKLDLEIMWFKEKRNCSDTFLNKTIPILESICVYCNRVFNNNEPIPCKDENCIHIFCSIKCVKSHYSLKHKKFYNF